MGCCRACRLVLDRAYSFGGFLWRPVIPVIGDFALDGEGQYRPLSAQYPGDTCAYRWVYRRNPAMETVYPKITSWLIGVSFVFVLLFPYVTQASMFLLKYNATGDASVAIKDSQCHIRQDEQSADKSCTLTLFNYGKEKEITLQPILPADISERMDAVFESESLRLIPHRTNVEGVSFTVVKQSGNVFTGNIRNMKFEVSTGAGR